MQDPPDWQELIAAVGTHLRDELIPSLEDPGTRFRTLIAANLLAIVARERKLGPRHAEQERLRLVELLGAESETSSVEALTQRLYQRVVTGEFDPGPDRSRLMAHLIATAVEKLQIANPKFLARLEAEDRDKGTG